MSRPLGLLGRGGPLDASPVAAKSMSFSFNFTYRDGLFDWRLLHGVDVESAIRLTDVQAVEDCLHTLRHGCIDSEKGLSARNCIQVFRLLQLAIEYIMHLKSAHASLLTHYEQAAAVSERWMQAAQKYLNLGESFIRECAQMQAMSKNRLGQVDQARAELEEQDRMRNKALDSLQDEDNSARYFHFRKQRSELNWQMIHAVNVEDLVANVDTALLDKVLHSVTYGSITGEDQEELTPHHFSQLVPLCQCCLDYVLFQANATGVMLDQAMSRLEAATADISVTAASVLSVHMRVSSLVEQAHFARRQQQQQQQQQQAALYPAGRPFTPTSAYGYPGTATGTFPGSMIPTLGSPAMSPGANAAYPFMSSSGLMLGMPGMPPASPRNVFEELLLMSAAGKAGSSPLPARAAELTAQAAEMHSKVDTLETNLRMERLQMEEMKAVLTNIRTHLSSSAATPSSASQLPDPAPGSRVSLSRRQSEGLIGGRGGDILRTEDTSPPAIFRVGHERRGTVDVVQWKPTGPGKKRLSTPGGSADAALGGGFGKAVDQLQALQGFEAAPSESAALLRQPSAARGRGRGPAQRMSSSSSRPSHGYSQSSGSVPVPSAAGLPSGPSPLGGPQRSLVERAGLAGPVGRPPSGPRTSDSSGLPPAAHHRHTRSSGSIFEDGPLAISEQQDPSNLVDKSTAPRSGPLLNAAKGPVAPSPNLVRKSTPNQRAPAPSPMLFQKQSYQDPGVDMGRHGPTRGMSMHAAGRGQHY